MLRVGVRDGGVEARRVALMAVLGVEGTRESDCGVARWEGTSREKVGATGVVVGLSVVVVVMVGEVVVVLLGGANRGRVKSRPTRDDDAKFALPNRTVGPVIWCSIPTAGLHAVDMVIR